MMEFFFCCLKVSHLLSPFSLLTSTISHWNPSSHKPSSHCAFCVCVLLGLIRVPCLDRWDVVHQSKNSFPVAILLKKVILPPTHPSNHELTAIPQGWWGLMSPSMANHEVLIDSALSRSHAGHHNHSESMNLKTMPCLEDFFLLHISPSSGSFILSAHSSVMLPEPWRGDTAVWFRAEHSPMTYSQHQGQFWASALTGIHCHKEPSRKGWKFMGINMSI